MEEIIQFQDQYYILATSSGIDEHSRVLKDGETFAVFDRYGNIRRVGLDEQGLYHEGTRFLSRLDVRLFGRRPLLLSSTVTKETGRLTVDLTNPDVPQEGDALLPRDTVHLFRNGFLWKAAYYERLRLHNYSAQPVKVSLSIHFEADFTDIFEVRGVKRERRGDVLPPNVGSDCVELRYLGLDEQSRVARIQFSPAPTELEPSRADFIFELPPRESYCIYMTVLCQTGDVRPIAACFEEARLEAARQLQVFRAQDAMVHSSNEQFNDWVNRSAADLHLMITHTPHGPYPYAGVPWFSAPFGRDGIITALEYLWINPEFARGVLAFLAATQATEVNPDQDAEPGKILHETRRGEMAALGEIPFGRYYGSVDATPLFVMLAGAYYERTSDVDFIRFLWPNIEAALQWIDCYGDPDDDGIIEYARHSPQGLIVQGWKDSFDSVFHADGTLAGGPIALCEVQGYVYAARRCAAQLAAVLGHVERAQRLLKQAEQIRQKFEELFWCDDLGTYALALDGDKQPCRVRTSNPGHCLFSGIVSHERAERLARTLMSEDSFSGWGVRTVAAGQARFNPMAYHNGSIWPHDNALIAAGMARYGLRQHVAQIFTGMFDTSLFVELRRMPELFCGFPRRPGEGPTMYPVACSPQSWAAAAVFSLLQSLLGLSIHAPQQQIRFQQPLLPESIHRLWIRNLRVGDAVVDLSLQRYAMNVGIELLRREGNVEIISVK